MTSLSTTFYKLLCVIRKELLVTLKDPKIRFILLLPVIVQGMLFGYTASFNLDRVPYALLDQSHSSYSADFIARLEGSGIFQRVYTLSSTAQIASAIDSGDVIAVVTVNQDFANQITAGTTAPVEVITDGRNPTTSGIAAGYISSIASAYSTELRGTPPAIEVVNRTWYNPNLITRWMFLPSLIPMLALTQVMMLAGLSVAREREQGTFDQLLVTPLQPYEILIAKAIPPMIIGTIQATLVLLLTIFWFGITPVGSIGTLYLTIFIFLLSSVGVGLSISAISDSMQQIMVYCFVILLPMLLLSGLSTPIQNMPDILQYATYINPMRFAVESVRRIYLEGAGLNLIAINYIPMLIVASITLPLAATLFRKKLS